MNSSIYGMVPILLPTNELVMAGMPDDAGIISPLGHELTNVLLCRVCFTADLMMCW